MRALSHVPSAMPSGLRFTEEEWLMLRTIHDMCGTADTFKFMQTYDKRREEKDLTPHKYSKDSLYVPEGVVHPAVAGAQVHGRAGAGAVREAVRGERVGR